MFSHYTITELWNYIVIIDLPFERRALGAEVTLLYLMGQSHACYYYNSPQCVTICLYRRICVC